MGVCNPGNDDYEVHWKFFLLYSLVLVAGFVGNVIIFCAYHFWNQRVLGRRASSAFLLRSLNIWDLTTCVFLLLNLITRHYENSLIGSSKPDAIGIFNSLRNVLIACAMFTLALIAFDRALAVCYPHNTMWTDTRAKWCLFSFAILTCISDLSVRLVTLYSSSRHVACWTETIYNYLYGGCSVLLLIFIYICYGVLFSSAYGFWQRVERRRAETMSRTRAWTMREIYVNSVESDENASRSSATSMSQVDEFGRSISTAPTTAVTNPTTNNQSWNSLPEQPIMEERKAQKRLVCVLFSITVSQTISVIPLFLFNASLIEFPGYILYYFFYLNCFMNPFIYFITRDQLRKYFLCLFRDPTLAFNYQGRF